MNTEPPPAGLTTSDFRIFGTDFRRSSTCTPGVQVGVQVEVYLHSDQIELVWPGKWSLLCAYHAKYIVRILLTLNLPVVNMTKSDV